MRRSTDNLAKDGTIERGFDYNLQVWVDGFIVLRCGHFPSYGAGNGGEPGSCCHVPALVGRDIRSIEGREKR